MFSIHWYRRIELAAIQSIETVNRRLRLCTSMLIFLQAIFKMKDMIMQKLFILTSIRFKAKRNLYLIFSITFYIPEARIVRGSLFKFSPQKC